MADCPLCLRMDCECEDILTKEEFDRLVAEDSKNETG